MHFQQVFEREGFWYNIAKVNGLKSVILRISNLVTDLVPAVTYISFESLAETVFREVYNSNCIFSFCFYQAVGTVPRRFPVNSG